MRVAPTSRLPLVGAVLLSTTAALMLGPASGWSVTRAQVRIDFARDVQPLLKERCYECHGPTKQMNGYRLDRRGRALAGVVRPNIVPGSSDSSRLYRRVLTPEFGTQMPPDDPLSAEEISVLKRWIDEGAEWPDALANEAPLPPQDPAATRVVDLIASSRSAAALQAVRKAPAVVNGRGPEGSTPLMYAALYGSAALVKQLLDAGADPNIRNNAGATALTWAVDDLAKVRLLIAAGADVNASSDFGRTPLMLAAAQPGSAPTVKLLLERGAEATSAALTAAANRGNIDAVRMLLAAGARDNNGTSITASLRANSRECLDAIVAASPPKALAGSLFSVLPTAAAGDPEAIRAALERGADVNARDAKSRTPLMLAAIADTLPAASVRLLLEKGADAAAKDPNGLTALDFARRLGRTEVVDALVAAGAPASGERAATLTFVNGNTVRDAVSRSLPLLQRTATSFYEKSGCVSCHNNTLTAVTVAAARRQGFAVDERGARKELVTVVEDIRATREQALQGIVSPGGLITTLGYILMGLAAEGHRADPATDAIVRLIVLTQLPDGRWRSAYRPPTEASEFTATAVALRGIQLYGNNKATHRRAIASALSWLRTARPNTTEDRVFQLLGLTWGGAPQTARNEAVRELLAAQRSDGGWGQLSSMTSDAYATGSVLVALHEGGVRAGDAAYRRGVQYLLETQLADGSWFVHTRSQPTQIYFESGFPHRASQFISAAATNWATQALIVAAREPAAGTATASAPLRTPRR
ncbi:MAG TPA: ankyrin repeat domain-containing protein [Vicinamibacterales bacterium]|nr:ankyrin repeat domain-containing protein [Vicinamibacterales bacterium]